MKRIIEMLKQDYDIKNRMLNATPPTTWFDLLRINKPKTSIKHTNKKQTLN